jgi:hypothetical protein
VEGVLAFFQAIIALFWKTYLKVYHVRLYIFYFFLKKKFF